MSGVRSRRQPRDRPPALVALQAMLALLLMVQIPSALVLPLAARSGAGATGLQLVFVAAVWSFIAVFVALPVGLLLLSDRPGDGSLGWLTGLLVVELFVTIAGHAMVAGLAGAYWLAPLVLLSAALVLGSLVMARRPSVFFYMHPG